MSEGGKDHTYCILSPSGSTEPSPLIEIVPPRKSFYDHQNI